jgi:peptidoglycan hydrolase CwlO-like protein
MTDYAATVAGRTALLQVAMQRVGTSSESVERYETELRQRERELENVMTLRWIEIQDEINRTSALLGQVATLEGKLRDRDGEVAMLREGIITFEITIKALKRKVKELEEEKTRRER